MKKISALLTITLLVMCSLALPDALINQTISLTTSTPVRVATIRTMASSIMVQMQPGSTNTGYVLYANPSATCSTSTTSQIAATLAPGTSTSPGSAYSYPTNNVNGGNDVDVSWFCVAGSSGDSVLVSYSQR